MTNTVLERDPRLVLQEEGAGAYVRATLNRMRTGDLGSLPVVIGIIIIWAVFQSQDSAFLSPRNLVALAVQISYGGLISLGIVMVLLLGEIDLSVGSMSGLCASVVGVLSVSHGWNPVLSILVAVAVGAGFGALQGFFFTRFHIPSFVVTLAGLLAFLGMQLKVLGDTGTLNFPFGGVISDLTNTHFGPGVAYTLAILAVVAYAATMLATRQRRSSAGLTHEPMFALGVRVVVVAIVLLVAVWELERAQGLPLAFVIFMACVLLFAMLTTGTTYGRHVFAVGGNVEAARRAGINISMIHITVFAISGGMAAFGGVMNASYTLSVSQSSGGSDLLLYSIAAAVIGGTSLFGGRGSAWSALLGWLVIGSIYNGMFLLGLKSDVQYMVIGGVLLVAAAVDALGRRGREASGRG